MSQKLKKRRREKLVLYITEDRPRKFKAYVNKYEINLHAVSLHNGGNLLHCAAKYGSEYFVRYLLDQGISVYQVDKKGRLPLHLALQRNLRSSLETAGEVFKNISWPFLNSYSEDFYAGCHKSSEIRCMIGKLFDRLNHMSECDDSDSSDQSSSDSDNDDWSERLAREFESESTDFFGRYDCHEDYQQEHQSETYGEWAARIAREMNKKRNALHGNSSQTFRARKKRNSSPEGSGTGPRVKAPKVKPVFNTKEEIIKAKTQLTLRTLRKTYEERFQTLLTQESSGGEMLCFGDIPWPSRGSIDHVMDVLFGDKTDWDNDKLKKYVRKQQVRWHPDKFQQKFADRITPSSFEKVMHRVKEISQALNKKAETLE